MKLDVLSVVQKMSVN